MASTDEFMAWVKRDFPAAAQHVTGPGLVSFALRLGYFEYRMLGWPESATVEAGMSCTARDLTTGLGHVIHDGDLKPHCWHDALVAILGHAGQAMDLSRLPGGAPPPSAGDGLSKHGMLCGVHVGEACSCATGWFAGEEAQRRAERIEKVSNDDA